MSRKKSVLSIVIALVLGAAIGVGATLGLTSGNQSGTVAADVTPDWVADAGNRMEELGYTYYVDSNDRFSAVIGSEDVTWLYTEMPVDGYYVSAWFGISNMKSMDGTPLFESGSRFSVAFTYIDNGYDDGYLVDIGVDHPDGTPYTQFGDYTEVFIQYGSMFDEDAITAISIGMDNAVITDKSLPSGGIEAPEADEYAVMIADGQLSFAF